MLRIGFVRRRLFALRTIHMTFTTFNKSPGGRSYRLIGPMRGRYVTPGIPRIIIWNIRRGGFVPSVHNTSDSANVETYVVRKETPS